MPTFEHAGASIYYEEFGQGFPILTFAPAGQEWKEGAALVSAKTRIKQFLSEHTPARA